MFCVAKLSMLCGFTKGVSVDVLKFLINNILENNLPYVQSGSDDFFFGGGGGVTQKIT